MKKSYLALLVSVIFILATVGSSFAAMGEGTVSAKKGVDLTLFGSNRFIPSYHNNLLDFDNDSRDSVAVLDEGGWGAGFFVRNELRLGFAGKGENFGFRVILENDIHYSKNNVDRNTYGGWGDKSSDFGSEFGVERSKFWYDFGPVTLTTGWDVCFQDLKSGGLVYGDDHPFIKLSGKAGDNMSWQLYMLLINDSDDLYSNNMSRDTDWYTYNAKFDFKFGGMTISPFFTYSDMRKGLRGADHGNAQSYYLGLEGYGKFGIFQPTFEIVGVTGTINESFYDIGDGKYDDYDISSFAAFAALKVDLMPEFQPYVGGYYVQGDDDNTDNDADGFTGVTSIQRYTPVFGMEGAIMYEHMSSLGAPLYGLIPETLNNTAAGNNASYGGILRNGTGDNPGLVYVGAGATGKFCNNISYKVQTAYLWFAEEDGLGLDDDEIGLTFDAQVKYPLSKNFVTSFTVSGLLPGDGTESLLGDDAEDLAIYTRAELVWKW